MTIKSKTACSSAALLLALTGCASAPKADINTAQSAHGTWPYEPPAWALVQDQRDNSANATLALRCQLLRLPSDDGTRIALARLGLSTQTSTLLDQAAVVRLLDLTSACTSADVVAAPQLIGHVGDVMQIEMSHAEEYTSRDNPDSLRGTRRVGTRLYLQCPAAGDGEMTISYALQTVAATTPTDHALPTCYAEGQMVAQDGNSIAALARTANQNAPYVVLLSQPRILQQPQ